MSIEELQSVKSAILCIDDEPTILMPLRALLEVALKDDYVIEIAESGVEALEIVKELQADNIELEIVISDYIMPNMLGDEVLTKIHQLSPKTITIMLTGQSSMEGVTSAINNANLYRFIKKPWHSDDLMLTISSAATSYNQERKLEQQLTLLKNFNEELEQTVKKRTVELEQAKAAADAASESKSQFLANMSHELRTPITTVIGSSQLLKRTIKQEEHQELLNTQSAAARHLLSLIDDLLDITRAEQGSINISKVPYNLYKVVQESLDLVQERANAKGINASLETKALPRAVEGDPIRLKQVLVNLLNNAIKYSDNGEVILRAEAVEADSQLLFTVTDQGKGISKQQQDVIFQPFEQLHDSNYNYREGVGLGLTICQRLVIAMDGTIGVTSKKNKGSSFWVYLPLIATDAQPQHSEEYNNLLPAMKILLVDDSSVNRDIISRLLKYDQHQVSMAKNGLEALELFKNNNFNLVLMDIRMPKMDGLEATTQIRKLEKGVNVPILGLTADTTIETISACKKVGMNQVITKPFHIDQLNAVLADNIQLQNFKNIAVPEVTQKTIAEYASRFSEEEWKLIIERQQRSLKSEHNKLETAWSNKNFVDLSQAAHKLISITGMVGYMNLSQIAYKIEQAAIHSDSLKIKELIDSYRSLVQSAIATNNKIVGGYADGTAKKIIY